tara:strand:- start:46 stop:534 length:489 start_codon:yes stop_codon:yes gene_type:complete
MICQNFDEFLKQISDGLVIMGLDLGEKTIGVAISDFHRKIATGIRTIKRKKFKNDSQALIDFANSRQVGGIVLGLPKNMNGSEGPRSQSTRAFGRNLSREMEIPITFWDERLSTKAAERVLIQADQSRRKRSQIIDYVAATYILQGALDRMNFILEERMNYD